MKFFIVTLLFVSSAWSSVLLSSLLGKWDYVGFHYQDHYYTKPNSDLHVTFDFQTKDKLRLSWTRDDDQSHCARVADYSIVDDVLYQKVIWLDPENSFGCSSDPDMVLGQTSETKFSTSENVLNLYLSLNGEELIYVLNRL